jgi:hypothetical protein
VEKDRRTKGKKRNQGLSVRERSPVLAESKDLWKEKDRQQEQSASKVMGRRL